MSVAGAQTNPDPGHGHTREHDERSTSSPVSTPPQSTPSPTPPNPLTSNTAASSQTPASTAFGSSSLIANNPQTAKVKSSANPDLQKKPRKQKPKDPNATDAAKPPKEKKPRKPREPKDPFQPARKRQKLSADGAAPATDSIIVVPPTSNNAHSSIRDRAPDSETKIITSSQPSSRPATSGQRYDPIRSLVSDYNADSTRSSTPVNASVVKPPTPSPRPPSSIMSLIDPPDAGPRMPAPRMPLSQLPNRVSPPYTASPAAPSVSITLTKAAPSPPPTSTAKPAATNGLGLSETDSKREAALTASPSKATKTKDVPTPMGSGLLSGSAFGKAERVPREYAEVPNQCIVIEVPMKSETGNYVNFMKEVEQKYGFDVAHPRLAEHRKRMRQIAAAGAALESGSGSADDLALDGSEGESNVEMGGMDEESGPGEAPAQKKKRQLKNNQYDKNDDFIDDTELIWEESALASRDGYFVWSGPLVPPDDKLTVESADGGTRRGRGGRGRGGAARGEASGRGGKTRGEGRVKRGDGIKRGDGAKRTRGAKADAERRDKAAGTGKTAGAATPAK